MQATLIYNPNAGGTGTATADALQDALTDAGYEPEYTATDRIEDLNPILASAKGLVVSAGGDGTHREVVTRIVGRDDVCITPLPMGTANNICHALGIEGNPLDLIKGLLAPKTYRLDIGQMQAPWGNEYFIEGAGLGFFAEALATYDPEQGKSLLRSVTSLIEILQNGFARETTLFLPDKVVHGKFLLVEALNTVAVGPRLRFAPDADPADGLLNIVCIRDKQRNAYLHYLEGLLAEEFNELSDVETYQVPSLEINWHGFPVHLDAVLQPPGFDFRGAENGEEEQARLRPYSNLAPDATLHLRVLPQAVEVRLPQPKHEDEV